jgi:hypothetical protein
MSLMVEDFTIGSASIDNVILRPGINKLPLKATTDMNVLMDNMMEIVKAQPDFEKSGILTIKTIGNTTSFNGQRIPYYEKVLNSLVLTNKMAIEDLMEGAEPGGNSTLALRSMAKKMKWLL